MSTEPAATTAVPETVRVAVAAALDRKALDLRVLELAEISQFTDFFLICSGRSDRQVQAIADAIREKVRGVGERPLSVEGYRNGQWIVLDYGDLVVHVFDEEMRRFYRLEGLWADAPDLSADLVR